MSDSTAFAPLIADVVGKATERTSKLHSLAKTIKAAGGSNEDLKKWIDESGDTTIVAKREAIAKALAKVQEIRDELMAAAKDANKSDVDTAELSKEFKQDHKELRTWLMQSKGMLLGLEVAEEDVAPIDEMIDNLPTLSGGLTASGLSPEELKARRDWARDNGLEVSDKGRVSKEIRAAYDAAHVS